MSDQPEGAGWWQASDGRWYPPERRPDHHRPPPLAPPTGSSQLPPPADRGAPARASGEGGRSPGRPRRSYLVGAGVLALVVAVAIGVVVRDGSDDASDPATPDENDASDSPASGSVGGDPNAGSDVGPCVLLDPQTIELDVTNSASIQSSYVIDVDFLDGDGQRVAAEPFFVNYVRPGERTVERAVVFTAESGVSCEVTDVLRLDAESPNDLADASCEVDGVDVAGDITAGFVVTNRSADVADFNVTGALVRDGLRIGTAFGFFERVEPGASVPGDGFSTVAGPPDGVACEVVYVELVTGL